jgi:urea transport system permease protein
MGSDAVQRQLFWLTVLLAVGAWLLTRWLTSGRFGDALIAIRDDEPRLRFTGYNPTAYKTVVFAVAGALAGVSGALYTVQSGIVSPQYMAVPFSIEMVIWVAVGGRGTLIGAVLGAVLINYARSLVSEALPETWLFIQGGLFLLVVTALPDGLVGWWRSGGPGRIQAMAGWAPMAPTYPSLDFDPAMKAEEAELSPPPVGGAEP